LAKAGRGVFAVDSGEFDEGVGAGGLGAVANVFGFLEGMRGARAVVFADRGIVAFYGSLDYGGT